MYCSKPYSQPTQKKPDEIKPSSQPISQPTNNANSPMKNCSLAVNLSLFQRIQTFLNEKPQLFLSFSHFLRDALIAYQNKSLTPVNTSFPNAENSKKSIRMNEELENLYRQLPEGQKTQTLNQILASFLEKNKG